MNAATDVLQSTHQHINRDRLWQSLMDLARLGATVKGGVCRLALTDLDRQARDIFVKWCEEAGCTVSIDAVGNIFARRPGRNPNLPPVMTGSHIDTQPTGGKFDGCFGVLAGVEVLRTLNDLGTFAIFPEGVNILHACIFNAFCCNFFQMRIFRHGAAKIVPHALHDALNFLRGNFWHGMRDIFTRAARNAKLGADAAQKRAANIIRAVMTEQAEKGQRKPKR